MRDVVVPHRRQNTAERYGGIIRRHIAPMLGHIELGQLSPLHVHEIEATLTARGMSPAGVELVHNVLSSAVKHAMRMELIHHNQNADIADSR